MPLPVSVKRLAWEEAARWDAFVADHPAGTPFHLTAWGRAIAATFGHDCHYLYAERDGAVAGVLPLIHIKSRIFGSSLISVAFAVYGGPLFHDPETHQALEAEAVRLRDALGASLVEYRAIDGVSAAATTNATRYATFVRAIDPDPEVNMKAIPRKQRAMVRKAIGLGLEARLDEAFTDHYRLYSESLRNLGTPSFPARHFANLKRFYGDDCDVLTVTHQGAPVASVLSLYFRGTVLPYYGGGGALARQLAGNDFMYWALMEHARARGCTLFDFGRSKVGTGAYAFKKNWGFEPRPLHYQYLLAPGAAAPDLNPLNPKYQRMIKLWQRLPLWVANWAGPLIVRSLG
ncbi:MAG: FemAB family XrtA/PEP-CTERM system-associated protein [Pseudomonadota bacterium]